MVIPRLRFLSLGFMPFLISGILSGTVAAAPAQSLAAATPAQPESSSSTPALAPASEPSLNLEDLTSENVVGIVKSIKENQLEIKLPDGQAKFYTAPPTFATNTLDRGSFVEVVLDPQGAIQDVKIPAVEKVVSGVISKIEEDKVTLELANGTQETTLINPATVERMNLTAGVPLTVTSYTGMTATKLCPTLLATCCQKPAAPLPPPLSLPPAGGGELPRRIVVPQKW